MSHQQDRETGHLMAAVDWLQQAAGISWTADDSHEARSAVLQVGGAGTVSTTRLSDR
jgi:hypothetical protein